MTSGMPESARLRLVVLVHMRSGCRLPVPARICWPGPPPAAASATARSVRAAVLNAMKTSMADQCELEELRREFALVRLGQRRLQHLAVVGGFVLGGCGDEKPRAATERGGADLNGRTFESAEVREHTLATGSIVTISFEDGGISAFAGCNRILVRRTGMANLDRRGPARYDEKGMPAGPAGG